MTRTSLSKDNTRTKRVSNYLWITRKKMGLAQKQVAFLLGHKNTTQLSRYEHGTRIPSLKTALKLEIAYAKPLRLLFSELYDEVREDIQKRREKSFVYKELKEK